jgi:hypothetical protein
MSLGKAKPIPMIVSKSSFPFDHEGNYAYVAPNKSSVDATKIFGAHTHESLGLTGSTEDMIEIDFADGKVSRVGDQCGVGRVWRSSTN